MLEIVRSSACVCSAVCCAGAEQTRMELVARTIEEMKARFTGLLGIIGENQAVYNAPHCWCSEMARRVGHLRRAEALRVLSRVAGACSDQLRDRTHEQS